jgi:hypothetical protein
MFWKYHHEAVPLADQQAHSASGQQLLEGCVLLGFRDPKLDFETFSLFLGNVDLLLKVCECKSHFCLNLKHSDRSQGAKAKGRQPVQATSTFFDESYFLSSGEQACSVLQRDGPLQDKTWPALCLLFTVHQVSSVPDQSLSPAGASSLVGRQAEWGPPWCLH